MYSYSYVREILQNEEVGEYSAYGVQISCITYEKCEPIQYISDVFVSEQDAKAFVDECNRLQLSPIHIDDVVQDVLGQ